VWPWEKYLTSLGLACLAEENYFEAQMRLEERRMGENVSCSERKMF
jgi:hypothetical protein